MASLTSLFWLLFIAWTFLAPFWRMRRQDALRVRVLRHLQTLRGSRVITMIHRQEALSLLGIPLARFITIEDSELVLRAIRATPPDVPIDLILHTPGGLVLASEQIAQALRNHRGKVSVMVPHYAMSGGTLIALAADEILLDENAVLGPVDPQIGSYPAASVLEVLRQKPVAEVDDRTLILGDIARKAMRQVKASVLEILGDRLSATSAADLAALLTEGRFTHDFPLTIRRLKEVGLEVTVGLPEAVYHLMDLYPQPQPRRPSVQYIPLDDGAGPDRRGR